MIIIPERKAGISPSQYHYTRWLSSFLRGIALYKTYSLLLLLHWPSHHRGGDMVKILGTCRIERLQVPIPIQAASCLPFPSPPQPQGSGLSVQSFG